MKFSIKDFFSKCDQTRSFLRIWSHLRKKSLMENFIFCAVRVATDMYNKFWDVILLDSVRKTNNLTKEEILVYKENYPKRISFMMHVWKRAIETYNRMVFNF